MGDNKHLRRKLGTISFNSGSTETLEIPTVHFLESLNLLVDYSVTTGTSAAKNGNGILDLVENIEVKFNGNKTPKSVSLAMSHFTDWYENATRPIFDPVDFSTAASQSGQVQTFVDFLLREDLIGTMLPVWAFSSCQLRIKWGTASDIGDDVTIDNASISVMSKERRKSTVKNPAQLVENELQVFSENEKVKRVQADGIATVDLSTSGTYTALPFQVIDGDSPDISLIEGAKVEDNDNNTHWDTTPSLIRAKDKTDYGIENLAPGVGVFNYGITESKAFEAGDRESFAMEFDTARAPSSPSFIKVIEQTIE